MNVEDLTPGLLVQPTGPGTRGMLLKVSTIYSDTYVSAEQVLPVPPRTTVRFYTAEEFAAWREPSKALLRCYDEVCEVRA